MPDQLAFPTYARDVIDVPVAEELSESFLAYSLSVITSRAIPDVRDGLKPVQRRILWSMLQMGIRPGTPFKKSARIVGDTMGRYHPHGDSAIYETLARMGQDFARMVPFIDPQGNFGSLDDPPAAARYTECRLSQAAMDMVSELDEDTVDFRPTYDGEGDEPTVLPAALPNILVNGTSGIAVGMATNMAPHNLREVEKAIELVMTKRRPKPTVDDLMAVLPGPDFPSGGIIVDDDLREAYETGRGSFRMRARAHVEQITRSRQAIIVTELPYLIGPERVMSKLKDGVTSGKLNGVAGFANLTDMNGLKLQIDVKPGVNPQALLQALYRVTPLEETFGINNVVLVNGVPTTLGLYDLCRYYIEHRLEVITRRTQYRLDRAQSRLHIVEGLLLALDAIDEVVAIIRSSQNASEARDRLMERFSLSAEQAAHILDMQLRRLTALARLDLDQEAAQLRSDIADYEKILGSDQRKRTLVLSELRALVEAHGVDRRSEIVSIHELPVIDAPIESNDSGADPDSDEPCVLAVSTSGKIGRVPVDNAKRASAGRHDLIVAQAQTSTAATVVALTSEGRALSFAAGLAGDGSGRARGDDVSGVLGLNKGEEVLDLVVEGDETQGDNLVVVVTAAGVGKRLTPEEVLALKSGKTFISLKNDDRVAAVFRAAEDADIVVVASDGKALRTAASGISVQGSGAGGVGCMKLKDGATVVGAGAVANGAAVLTVTSDGGAKATPFDEVPVKGRNGQGVRIVRLATGAEVSLAYVGPTADLLAQMASDDDPKKVDPHPVPFHLEPTKRDLVAPSTDRQIFVLAPNRW